MIFRFFCRVPSFCGPKEDNEHINLSWNECHIVHTQTKDNFATLQLKTSCDTMLRAKRSVRDFHVHCKIIENKEVRDCRSNSSPTNTATSMFVALIHHIVPQIPATFSSVPLYEISHSSHAIFVYSSSSITNEHQIVSFLAIKPPDHSHPEFPVYPLNDCKRIQNRLQNLRASDYRNDSNGIGSNHILWFHSLSALRFEQNSNKSHRNSIDENVQIQIRCLGIR